MAELTRRAARSIMVATDLDGSLLDFFTYSWKPAVPAIRLLKQQGIPLVFCSSKTRAELIYLQDKMGITDPFISETGGAIWFWPKSTQRRPSGSVLRQGLYAIVLGLPYRKLRSTLAVYRKENRLDLVSFGDLPEERVAELCSVPLPVAKLVLQRDFDEPFFFTTPPPRHVLDRMRRHFAQQGMRILRGGRFYHLVGPSDKGRAIARLRRWHEQRVGGPVIIVGLGDSPNDIPLFEASDIRFLVKRHDGSYDPTVRRAIRTHLAGDIGPAGWNRAIMKLLGGD